MRLGLVMVAVSSLMAGCEPDSGLCPAVDIYDTTLLGSEEEPGRFRQVEEARFVAPYEAADQATTDVSGEVIDVVRLEEVERHYCESSEIVGYSAEVMMLVATDDGRVTLELPATIAWEHDGKIESYVFEAGLFELTEDEFVEVPEGLPDTAYVDAVRVSASCAKDHVDLQARVIDEACTQPTGCKYEQFVPVGAFEAQTLTLFPVGDSSCV